MTTTNNNNNNNPSRRSRGTTPLWISALSGSCAGAISAVFTNPLDVVKTRLQVQQYNVYSGTIGALRTIYQHEGIRGYYHGLQTTMLGLVPTWMIYFTVYTQAKSFLGRVTGKSETPSVHVMSAMIAGSCTNIVTNPLWVMKTRFHTQSMVGREARYQGVVSGLVKIAQEEGVKGLYSGLVPSMIGVIHVCVQFPLYEAIKKMYAEQERKDVSELGFLPLVIASAVSKLVASIVAYPHEVLRAKLQDQNPITHKHYKGFGKTVSTIMKEEGLRGFYRGLSTNLIRSIPAAIVTFTSYEEIRKALEHHYNER